MAQALNNVPFLNATTINLSFTGIVAPRCLALRLGNVDGLRPTEMDNMNNIKYVAMYIYLDTIQATGITPQGYELAYRYYQECCGVLQHENMYLDQADARLHMSEMLRSLLSGEASRGGRAVSAIFVDELRTLYTACHALPNIDRTIGGQLHVMAAPPADAADWPTWGGTLTAEQVAIFIRVAVGGGVRRAPARYVDWMKGGIVYIWYTLLFAGTSNARKFAKFVTQCGLTNMECQWPTDVGVLSTMFGKMTVGMDRAAFANLFEHMANQGAIQVLGLKNMVAQARFHGTIAIMMIVQATKDCGEFNWGHVHVMWPLECASFMGVIQHLTGPNNTLNPWGGFGTMAEKNAIRSTQFRRLTQLAYDIQVRFMGNTSIQNVASFGNRAVYGKWANTVDGLMTAYDDWIARNMNPANMQAHIPVVAAANALILANLVVPQ